MIRALVMTEELMMPGDGIDTRKLANSGKGVRIVRGVGISAAGCHIVELHCIHITQILWSTNATSQLIGGSQYDSWNA